LPDASPCFFRTLAAWRYGGRGAWDVANRAEEDEAQRWFRRIAEVTVWTSCRRRVVGGRSVGADMAGGGRDRPGWVWEGVKGRKE
jgi:hypothetical protein